MTDEPQILRSAKPIGVRLSVSERRMVQELIERRVARARALGSYQEISVAGLLRALIHEEAERTTARPASSPPALPAPAPPSPPPADAPAVLRRLEEVVSFGHTQKKIAELAGLRPQALNKFLLEEHSLTPEQLERLGGVLWKLADGPP